MLAVVPPLAPMLAKLSRTLPTGDLFYEPKWDGFRTLAFADDRAADLRSRNDKKLARYFPEVVEAMLALDRPVALDGEIVVVTERGLDFASLMSRLHPAASRVERLRRETPAAFIAFDVVAIGGEDLRSAPFAERRARLEELLRDPPSPHLLLTPSTRDRDHAEDWLERLQGAGVDGVVAKPSTMPYAPGKRAMIKVKRQKTLDCVVAGMRLMPGPCVGSLLLGLYDEDERLVHVGVASQLSDALREELLEELRPLLVPIEGHPWEHGFGLARSPLGRLAGSAGRWAPGEMERDWIPLAPTRVCEVTYDTIDDRRLRFPARLVRFRPDRDPSSCRVDQIPPSSLDVRALVEASP